MKYLSKQTQPCPRAHSRAGLLIHFVIRCRVGHSLLRTTTFYFFGTVSQSFKKRSIPFSVNGWLIICIITLYGTVAISQPAFAASITWIGLRMLAAIISVSKSGKTVRMISKYRPACPIIGCSTEPHVCRQLNLSWGVTPMLIAEENNTDELFEHTVDAALEKKFIHQGELVVITAGVPLGISGTTNLLKVHVAGHILVTGRGLNEKTTCASLCVCNDIDDVKKTFSPGDILVVPYTNNQMLPYLKKASAIITEQGNETSHAAVVGLSLDIPVIIEAENATKILRSGAVVTVDSAKGVVYYSGAQN